MQLTSFWGEGARLLPPVKVSTPCSGWPGTFHNQSPLRGKGPDFFRKCLRNLGNNRWGVMGSVGEELTAVTSRLSEHRQSHRLTPLCMIIGKDRHSYCHHSLRTGTHVFI